MKKLIILWSLVFVWCAHAQENRLKYAEKHFDNYAFHDAASGFEDAVARGTDSAIVADKLAESYFKEGNMEKALVWYDFLNRRGSLSQNQLLRLIYVNLYNGNYSKAIEGAKNYENKFHDKEWCKNLIREQKLFSELLENTNFIVASVKFNNDLSDFGVSYFVNSHILFVSNRLASGFVYREDAASGNRMFDMVIADLNDKNELVHCKKVKGIKDHYNEGPACIDTKHGWIYFSSDNGDKKKKNPPGKIMPIKIYRGKWDGEKVRSIEELNFNGDDFSCAHPSISADGSLLYFSSDRPGGYGGSDLYRAPVHADGSLGAVQNLGDEVNTPGNEYFPFIHLTENILFFSSDGHLGYGGLDNFQCKIDKSFKAFGVRNLGRGINSPQDDFAFVSNENQTKGFFSSNRVNGKGGDDIYSFAQLTPIKAFPEIKGVIVSADSSPIENVLLIVKNEKGEIIDSTRTLPDGSFYLNPDEMNGNVLLETKRSGFLPLGVDIQYNPQETSYTQNLTLKPDLAYLLSGKLKDKDSNLPIDQVKITVTDLSNGSKYSTVTDANGNFNTDQIQGLKFNDTAKLEVKLEKSGYVTITKTFDQKLGASPEITVAGMQAVQLNKIVVGKTNLANVVELNPIYFDFDKWLIRPDAAIELDKIVKIMQDNPNMAIELGSHTDTRGAGKENQILSQKRADASAAYILSKGIAANRIKAKGYGESKPKVPDSAIKAAHKWDEQEKLHQLNRRTEFIIVKG